MKRMKSLVFLFLFTVLFLTLSPPTQADDQVGIFFDTGYSQNQINVTDVPTPITGYLVLNRPTTSFNILGWECCVGLEGPAIFTSWELEGQTINVLEPPCFMVGIGADPLPPTEDVLLATFQVLLTEPTPVTFSLEPVFYPSYPGEMAYLTGEYADEIKPMYTITGYPEVASINQDNPWPSVSHETLYFDEQPLGSTTIRNITVTNVGGGYLHLDITLPEGELNFSLPGLSGPTWVASGNSVNIPVSFTPLTLGEITSTLDLGPQVTANVALHGIGREPIYSWNVTGSLDFGNIAVGAQVTRAINIFNTGEVPIPIDPFIRENCSGFQLENPDPFLIQPGSNAAVSVIFIPPFAGTFNCALELGTLVEPQLMIGVAHDPDTNWTVTPSSLDFGVLVEGASMTLPFVVQNTGEAAILLDVGLDDSSGFFHLDSPYGQFNLTPGSTRTFSVIFAPQAQGQFDAQVTLGDSIPPVPLTGLSEAANPQCNVVPQDLDFGTTVVGGGLQRYFTVSNSGNVDLEIFPSETSDHFFIQPYPQTIPPGTSHQFMVLFSPQASGYWECDISLAGSGCPSVHCSGTAQSAPPPPGDTDLVGIFFDTYFTEFETFVDGVGMVEGYLVLKNPTVNAGVLGWECQHQVEGPALLVGATIMGLSINVGTAPDYIVGLAEPLPPAPDVHLATFQYFVFEAYEEVLLTLDPASVPSLPGYMAFLSGDDPDQILPMMPYTGYREVAYINVDVLDVERPVEPEILVNGGLVRMSWDIPQGSYQGYHVYRRDELGDETRLTAEPGSITGNSVSFTDQPVGFEAGSVLYYSYSLLKNNVETARSPEVQYEVQNVPAQLTRLLPNVPNPFNPQTKIRFELANSGQARVSIYDVSGRLVRTLATGSLAAGSHQRVWQGKDNGGRQVPSGAYYVRLETPDGVDHRKIMLLK